MDMSFSGTLTAHLEAVQCRDLPGLSATLAEEVSVIMLDGRIIEGLEAVEGLHREWFTDPDWTIGFTVVNTVETDGCGVALVRVDYTDLDAEGRPLVLEYLLGLTFVLDCGRWRLIHDQNTPC